jgi:hypothetical protein
LLCRIWQLHPSQFAGTRTVVARLTSFSDGSYRLVMGSGSRDRYRAAPVSTGL